MGKLKPSLCTSKLVPTFWGHVSMPQECLTEVFKVVFRRLLNIFDAAFFENI